jgi:hypothetical protein
MNRLVLIALMWPAIAVAQSGTAKLQGAWKVVEVTVTGDGGYSDPNPQAGLILFTRSHYSIMTISSRGPRPGFATAKDPAHLTDAEKLARYEQWNFFASNGGTYEVKGDTIITHAMVAKNESVMTGPPGVRLFRLEGNTLWYTQKRTTSSGETRVKLVRVE